MKKLFIIYKYKSIHSLIYLNVDEYPRWAKGPELNVGRLYHAAGTIRDSVTNEDIIVVTGGERDGGPEGTLDSVELLFQFNQNFWTSGK